MPVFQIGITEIIVHIIEVGIHFQCELVAVNGLAVFPELVIGDAHGVVCFGHRWVLLKGVLEFFNGEFVASVPLEVQRHFVMRFRLSVDLSHRGGKFAQALVREAAAVFPLIIILKGGLIIVFQVTA